MNRDSHFNVIAGSWCCCHSLDQPATIAAKRLGSSSVASRATSSGSHSLHSLITDRKAGTAKLSNGRLQQPDFRRKIAAQRGGWPNRRTNNKRSRSRCDRSKDKCGTKARSAFDWFDSGIDRVCFDARSDVLHSDRATAKFLVAPTHFLLLTSDSEHHVHN